MKTLLIRLFWNSYWVHFFGFILLGPGFRALDVSCRKNLKMLEATEEVSSSVVLLAVVESLSVPPKLVVFKPAEEFPDDH